MTPELYAALDNPILAENLLAVLWTLEEMAREVADAHPL
jgi:hypothetical protein